MLGLAALFMFSSMFRRQARSGTFSGAVCAPRVFTLRHMEPVLNPDGKQAISAGGVRTHAGVRTGGGSKARYAAARGTPNQEEQRTIED